MEWTRERVPLDWALAQNNLGIALGMLGRLEEAATAFRNALMERTRERVPLDWAQTQNNLGGALLVIGDRETGTARLEEAVAAYRDALSVFEVAQASYFIDGTRRNLAAPQRSASRKPRSP